MIGRIFEAATELGWTAVEHVWGWRQFSAGPPAAGFTSVLFGGTAVNREQAGLSVSWRGDQEGLIVRFNGGPLELWLHVAGVDASVLESADGLCREWVVRSEDGRERRVHLYGPINNVGVLLEWDRPAAGLCGRLSLGPVGVAVEPGDGPQCRAGVVVDPGDTPAQEQVQQTQEEP